MTDPKRATPPRIVLDPEEAELAFPPPRVPDPRESREVLMHWILTVGGFSAMLLIGWLFTG